MWRNASEILVSLTSTAGSNDGERLEVWTLAGQRRLVLTARQRLDAVRPDGSAAVTSKGVVDLASGASAEMPGNPGRVLGSVVLRTDAASPSATSVPRSTPTPADQRLVRALAEFAQAPSAQTFAAIPLADKVALGLGDQIRAEHAAGELAQTDAWVLRVSEFQQHVGPFSALDLLGRNVTTTISIGDHPHCAGPPVPAPVALAGTRRVSIQPKQGPDDSCITWWSVDVFVSPSGSIEGITLDFFGP
jgi:hypothetical protein